MMVNSRSILKKFFNQGLWKKTLIAVLIISWLFSGWPHFFDFPPRPQAANAAITYQSAGAVTYSGATGTAISVACPASISAGNLLVMIIGQKPSSANSGTATTPSGWTAVSGGSLTGAGGYGTTLGADTGNTNVYSFYRVADGTESSNLVSVALGTNNIAWGQMYRFSSSTTVDWSVAATTGSDTSGDASVSIAMSSNPGVTAGDYIVGGMVIPTDVTTPSQFSAEALSQTSVTFGTVSEIAEADTSTGNQIGGFTFSAPVSSGTGSANPTVTATAGGTLTNVRGPGIFIRVRETATPGVPTFYDDDGGANQIAFKNARINDTTPIVRASAVYSTTFNRFQVEFNTAADFSGTAYTETFSSTYSSATAYNLQTTATLNLPSTDGVTYYVRARASANAGTNYGLWSTEARAYTYKSSGTADWFQSTDAQFTSDTLSGAVASGSGSAQTYDLAANQYFTDFSEYTTGSLPSDWTRRWASDGTDWIVREITGSSGGKVLRAEGDGTSRRRMVSWNDIDSASATVEMFSQISLSAASSDGFLAARGSGAAAAETGYRLGHNTTTYGSEISRYSAGTFGRIGYAQYTPATSTWYKFRAQMNGTALKLKQWIATAPEPAAWNAEYTDSTITAAGWIGLAAYISTSAGGTMFDDFGVGVGGTAAPTNAPTSTGTVMSPEIDFDHVPGQTAWKNIALSTTETNGDVKLRVYYTASTACDTIVPDGALAGNSSGFDVSASPISIAGLSTTTYNRLCLQATLTDSGGSTPYINDWTVTRSAGLSTSIEVRAQNYTTAVSSITFPQSPPGSDVTQPYNDVNGSGSPQAFGSAGVAKPVVTLYNGGAVSLTVWYNITTFTNGTVASEGYLVNGKGAACANAAAITGSVTFDADTSTGVSIAAGAGNEKDLYLKTTLSGLAAKSGSSTLTILGET